MEPSLAHWCSGSKVRQGTEWPGRQTGCGRLTMPALQSVSSVLSAKQTLYFPLGLVALSFIQWPEKDQKSMGRQKELYIPFEQ